ncbi:hypothetical protein LOK49_LG09G02804 [Camellia lanceoleosa]|uniref:Uncharacterized protein n=1 Tax=Camellia lanceoleosa TaxID=1840588 RepID=A0ACC0GGK5_9ERIC|nr:hypothetical protein LOK49_LG09G02804 [Camellia lanceoleosa]
MAACRVFVGLGVVFLWWVCFSFLSFFGGEQLPKRLFKLEEFCVRVTTLRNKEKRISSESLVENYNSVIWEIFISASKVCDW